jgi:hypothetical protein
LRLAREGTNASRLYTHDPAKWHGVNFFARRRKHAAAYEFVKAALAEELGPERAKHVLKKAGLLQYKAITVGDMRSIAAVIAEQDQRATLLPGEMNIVRDKGGNVLAGVSTFSLSEEQKTSIAEKWIDLLKTGRRERSALPGALVCPQFLADSDRMSRRFASGNANFELRDIMSDTTPNDRARIAHERLAPIVGRLGDPKVDIDLKVWDLTRLVTQTALGDVWILLSGMRDGTPIAAGTTGKTQFEYGEEMIDDQSYITISIVSVQDLAFFTYDARKVSVALRDEYSCQRIDLKLRLRAADLGGELKDDSLEVVDATLQAQMAPSRTQPDG